MAPSDAEVGRSRASSLIDASTVEFRPPEALNVPDLEADSGWRFRSLDGSIEADVFVVEDERHRKAAVDQLTSEERTSEWGLPAVSTNGNLVFVVRYTGAPGDTDEVFRALGVASALAGEEE